MQRSLLRPLLGSMATLCASLLLTACQPIQPESPAKVEVGIASPKSDKIEAAFDLVQASVVRDGDQLIFRQRLAGEAGSVVPGPSGELAGAPVESYVWPTSLDSAAAGFEAKQGILALAVTAHPDFDDTPAVDENKDGKNDNDGGDWHSHWVVLVGDEACGAGGLKVQDIPEGQTPTLPATWPQLPLLIDSPNFALALAQESVTVNVPQAALTDTDAFNYDGVTAALMVHADLHAPLLCVTGVHDVASGDLSLPGKVE